MSREYLLDDANEKIAELQTDIKKLKAVLRAITHELALDVVKQTTHTDRNKTARRIIQMVENWNEDMDDIPF